ncbi:MAG: secretion protein HlyD family protein [Chloroflexi bacterium]|nr:secretion protein HlyD family protein [Chloroflexota bacterium]
MEPGEFKYLSFPGEGRIGEILVKEGEPVSEGQVLARLGDAQQAQAGLSAAILEVQSAQQALDELNRTAALVHSEADTALIKAQQNLTAAQAAWDAIDNQQTRDDIETASTKVADAQKELNTAKDDFEPYKDLPQDNSQRKSAQTTLDDANKTYSDAVVERDTLVNEFNLAEATLLQAKQALTETQHTFDQTKDGPDPDKLTLAQMRLDSAKAQQAAAQLALDNTELKAPFAGKVMDINVVQNELVNPGNWAVLVADTGEWLVRTSDLTELEVVNVSEGQKVEIVPDALPDLTLNGIVQQISNTYTTKSGDILYEVKVKLDEVDPRLRWGMTVEARFKDK